MMGLRENAQTGRMLGIAMHEFYEFFAGGGMVRAGLGVDWRCLFANDFDHKKARIYRENWGESELRTVDIDTLTTQDLPASANLAWASFPCQDLSLAGGGAGLKGERSGTFWPFWKLMEGLVAEGRAPGIIGLENVCGTLNSHAGKDFATICGGFQRIGYRVGAMVIDASLFVPQSRPRLFVIGVHESVKIPESLVSNAPSLPWHTRSLRIAYEKLPTKTKASWVWWKLSTPPRRKLTLADIIETNPSSAKWYSVAETRNLLAMMSDLNLAKLQQAKLEGRQVIGGLYRRTREDEFGRKVQRAEIRFDDVSGCLRTPAGGSSRQVILVVDGSSVRARLISSRETARLMGLPDAYKLPENYNEAYHITGDGVVVPVVRHLAKHIFEPILNSLEAGTTAAA
jgi:DNA (cytosine-5)-methyltransferase 1